MKPVDPRLLRYAAAARGFLAASAVIGMVQTGVTIAFAWLLTDAVTGALAGRDVTASVVWLLVTALVRGTLIAASDAAGTRAAARTGMQLRVALIHAVGRLGPGWLAQRNQAGLAVTAGHGLEALDAYFARYIPQLVLTVIATPVLLIVMWWQDWPSGLTAAITLPLIPLFLILIGMATRTVQQQQWQTLQKLAARFADTVQGLATLRLFGREQRAVARIETTADEYRRETMKVLRFSFLSGFAMELLASLAIALIAVSIGFRLLSGELSLEVGLFVLLLAPEAFLPIRQVGVQFHAAAEGVAATEDVFEVLDAAGRASSEGRGPSPRFDSLRSLNERGDEERGSSPRFDSLRSLNERGHKGRGSSPRFDSLRSLNERGRGSLNERGNRSFNERGKGSLGERGGADRSLSEERSDESKRGEARTTPAPQHRGGTLIVRDLRVRDLPPVSFEAAPGTITLIEGPSGSGKTSLLAALRGAADFAGEALYDGRDVRELDPAEWLAWAGQRPGLLAGTVGDNVALGGPAPAPDRIHAALTAACADGIDAARQLGVQGGGLSGGQAQRVAVARALYRHAAAPRRVLVLDEPSSALDADTEARLWRSLRERVDAGATILLVSHRRSAREVADRVVALGVAAWS